MKRSIMKKIAILLSLIFSVNSIVFANNGIKASVGEVTTFAGSGTSGSSDGTGTEGENLQYAKHISGIPFNNVGCYQ